MSDSKGHPTPRAPQNQPNPQPQTIPVLRTTILHHSSSQVAKSPDGVQLQVLTPNGELFILPFDTDSAQALGKQLAAPSVHVPNGSIR